MEGRLHGSARTTPRIRAELQESKESNRQLAARYRLNVKTVAKWRSRSTTMDSRMGPALPRSAKLTLAEEEMVVEFRRRTLLPLDDMLGHLHQCLPQLSRSALYRCLLRHGISQLPKSTNAPKRGKFAPTEMGYLHIDSSELRLESGKQHMFVAIDRVTKFTYVALFNAATKRNGAMFLRQAIEAFPYQIHTVLTDNGAAFTEQSRYRSGATNHFGGHIFDRVCYEYNIKHRLTKPYHPESHNPAADHVLYRTHDSPSGTKHRFKVPLNAPWIHRETGHRAGFFVPAICPARADLPAPSPYLRRSQVMAFKIAEHARYKT